MVINSEELKRRLDSSKNLANRSFFNKDKSVNPVNTNNRARIVEIPAKKNEPQIKDKLLRTIIGSLAAQGESLSNISQEFNVTKQQITSARDSKVPEIAIPREKTLDRVRELALDKLMLSLKLMTTDKFENADLKTLAIVSASAARVVEKLMPKEDRNTSQLVIYAPEIRPVGKFKVIDV